MFAFLPSCSLLTPDCLWNRCTLRGLMKSFSFFDGYKNILSKVPGLQILYIFRIPHKRNGQEFSKIFFDPEYWFNLATTTTNWKFLWRNENDPTNIYLSWFANQYRSGGNWANCHPHIVQCTLVGWEWRMLCIYIILIRDAFRNKNGI